LTPSARKIKINVNIGNPAPGRLVDLPGYWQPNTAQRSVSAYSVVAVGAILRGLLATPKCVIAQGF
jgi:hypothetical protein